ncbi:DNA-binding protein [Protaetiibacter larvae]|uniref:DNA-binding protein n=1 Tax=Protaetiibacter larvae TaxID=2592654 RepID=A0A5C1Y952_9MICO|nr:DNA-binding protein [Protaetiibacter larvae]QEO09898.1 DNA-binding protein [Protaetiibacter larvae]
MFAITADQVDSRHGPALGDEGLALVTRVGGERLSLPPDRTAGDEVQALTADAATALALALALARTGRWSVGIGIGEMDAPLVGPTRTANGAALVAARAAVESAKKRPLRAAVAGGADGIRPSAATVQTSLELLLQLRDRRSPEGWELHDLVEAGLTQVEAAQRLGITPQAASKRAIAAGLRLDAAARTALTELLELADASAGRKETR